MGGKPSLNYDTDLKTSHLVFFCETWIKYPTACLSEMDFYSSDAMSTAGRNSGGIELYVSPEERSYLVSKSSNHLCVKLSGVYIIGVYYKPTLEYDDRISDLVSALSACTDKDHVIIIGGDFKMRAGSSDFINLLVILQNYSVSLISDPNAATFKGNRGNYTTPDHIFCSTSIRGATKVIVRPESDHFPLILKADIDRDNRKISEQKILDVEKCRADIIPLLNTFEDESSNDLTVSLQRIFEGNRVLRTRSPSIFSHEINLLKEETKRALNLAILYKTPFFDEVYKITRRKLQQAIRVE